MKTSRLNVISDWIGLGRAMGYGARKLADKCRVSCSQLRRYFEQIYGRSAQEWLDELRLWDAAELLVNGNSVKEVAAALSFGNSAHFCHRFKDYHGCTPNEFLNLFRKRQELAPDSGEGLLPPPWEEAQWHLRTRIPKRKKLLSPK